MFKKILREKIESIDREALELETLYSIGAPAS
jgi:hypothetical protein